MTQPDLWALAAGALAVVLAFLRSGDRRSMARVAVRAEAPRPRVGRRTAQW